MIQKPLPLIQDPSPKDALKFMLEASERHENGLPSPLDEIDPQALDELTNRIDSGALALNQIPDPKDVANLVQYYWTLREKHNLEIQLGISSKPARKARTTKPILSLQDLIITQLEDEE